MSDTAEAIAQARKAVEPDKPKHVLRTLGQSIREYKKASILAPVFVTVEGILEILIPTIMASLIDEGITGGSMPDHRQVRRDSAGVRDVSLGAGSCPESTRPWPARLRQEPAQGPVREGAGLQLHQY